VAVAGRQRSDFLGEISDFQDNRQLTFIKGETVVDLQAGYEFQKGPAKGLSVLFQVNNASNAKFQRYSNTPDNIVETVKYGKIYLMGATYKF
jgi:iron complex outermembrane receptor protein